MQAGTIGGVLLTISTTLVPATDLGYLLYKHPGKAQSRAVASGTAHVFYPQASQDRCTAALLLEVDPVALVRGKGMRGKEHDAPGITHYVNDRPYAASSLLAVALKEVFGTALTGRCDVKPDLAASVIPLEIRVPALRCVHNSAAHNSAAHNSAAHNSAAHNSASDNSASGAGLCGACSARWAGR